jgi:hypothetical protein
MSSRALPGRAAAATAALTCGAWAAAVALAPTLTAKALLAAPPALLLFTGWTVLDRGRWVRIFLLAAILLPPLPIAMGDSGPHPAALAAGLGFFASLLWLREWTAPANGVAAPLAAMLFVLACSLGPAAFYSGVSIAFASAARVALFAITPLVFGYTAFGPGRDAEFPLRDVRRLYAAGVAGALFACADFYFQWPPPAGFGAQYVWLESGVYRRAQGLFYEASTLGNFCAFFLVMIAAALARPARERPVGRAGLLGGGAVLLAALAMSYSRGSVVCLLVALLALGWVHRRRAPSLRLAAGGVAVLPLAAFFIWKVFPRFAEMYWFRLSATAEYLFSSTNGVLSGRVDNWRILLDWIGSHPWQLLFGIGYKTLPYSSHFGGRIVADNMYLGLLIETGIAGLTALVWMNSAILFAARRASRAADPVRAFLGTWIFCFWAGESVQMLSGDLLTYWRVLPVYFFVLALAVRR